MIRHTGIRNCLIVPSGCLVPDGHVNALSYIMGLIRHKQKVVIIIIIVVTVAAVLAVLTATNKRNESAVSFQKNCNTES
jgi:uncharacterized membrane protein